MLPAASWLPLAEELPLGARRRVDHDCGGGRTLTVEHKDGGYSAWCFRCSDKGWHPHPQPSLAERIARLNTVRAAESAAEACSAPPTPTSFEPSDWPLQARVWLYSAGFSNDTIKAHGFYHAGGLDRVVLPVIAGGAVRYWQARGFDKDRPKYLNPPIDKPIACYGEAGPLVLTEDILSAARVGEVAKGRCILGTSLPTGATLDLVRQAQGRPVLVWLDGDAAGRKGSSKIVRALRLIGVDGRVIRSPLDPKLYPTDTIREFIQSALK